MNAMEKNERFIMNMRINKTLLQVSLMTFAVCCAAHLTGADFEPEKRAWTLDAGLKSKKFEAAVQERGDEGMRIVDLESYIAGHVASQAAIWVKSVKGEKSFSRSGMTLGEFKEEHAKQLKKGLAISDFEATRDGATLDFGAVWTRFTDNRQSVVHYGMDELLFSNRYGEMADRDYRLIDFEAYEANGRTLMAAIWTPNNGVEPRFYRGLKEEQFRIAIATMEGNGFRIIDIEAYPTEDGLRYAAAWSRMKNDEASAYAFQMLADEFYQTNGSYQGQGYRLVDFDAYDVNGTLRYSGSWVKSSVEKVDVPEESKFKDMFKRKG